jgi:hypothetical protein
MDTFTLLLLYVNKENCISVKCEIFIFFHFGAFFFPYKASLTMKEPAIWEPILAIVLLFVTRQLFYRLLDFTCGERLIIDITITGCVFICVLVFVHAIFLRLNPRVKVRGAIRFYRLLFQYDDEKGFTHSLLDDSSSSTEEDMKSLLYAPVILIMVLFIAIFYAIPIAAVIPLLSEPFRCIWVFSGVSIGIANIVFFSTLVDFVRKTRGLLYSANVTLWFDLGCTTLEVSIDSTKAMQCTMHPLSVTKEEVTAVVEPQTTAEPVTKCEPIDYYNVLVENQWRLIQTKYLHPDTLKGHIVFNSTDIDTECNTLFKENRQKLKKMDYYVLSTCPCYRNKREVCMSFQKIDRGVKVDVHSQ